MNSEMSRLTAENQQFRNAGSPELAEIAAAVGQAVQTAISNANPRTNERQGLVDSKGLGKTSILPRKKVQDSPSGSGRPQSF